MSKTFLASDMTSNSLLTSATEFTLNNLETSGCPSNFGLIFLISWSKPSPFTFTIIPLFPSFIFIPSFKALINNSLKIVSFASFDSC
ncbi:MAG: hypothetical protein ACD_31C00051G0001 [uncultured bacterium]|nr:MAG: hypothetical protein ACD_31C00051G0001 [uncultured bacterium]